MNLGLSWSVEVDGCASMSSNGRMAWPCHGDRCSQRKYGMASVNRSALTLLHQEDTKAHRPDLQGVVGVGVKRQRIRGRNSGVLWDPGEGRGPVSGLARR